VPASTGSSTVASTASMPSAIERIPSASSTSPNVPPDGLGAAARIATRSSTEVPAACRPGIDCRIRVNAPSRALASSVPAASPRNRSVADSGGSSSSTPVTRSGRSWVSAAAVTPSSGWPITGVGRPTASTHAVIASAT
jgi:hypothetical protein